ncbi:MAG: hypothetical protein AAFQ20_11555 [Bacteroidota bacterium]
MRSNPLMRFKGQLQNFSKEIKGLLLVYLFVTSIGFLSALQFVNLTTEGGQPKGIQENYLGNEEDEAAEELKFAKSEKQILNIVHTHMMAMGMLFFLLAGIFYTTPTKGFLRKFLLFEPLLSVLLTFSGIYLLFKGILWMRYVIAIPGILMTASYILTLGIIIYFILKKPAQSPSES